MKTPTVTLKNVYGIPYINEATRDVLEANGITIVVGIDRFFAKKYKHAKGFTVVVEQFGKLASSGIPVLGYQKDASAVWRKIPVDVTRLEKNEVEIALPKYIGYPDPFKVTNAPCVSLPLLLEFQACKSKKDFKKLAAKYEKEIKKPEERKFKWFARAVKDQIKAPKETKEQS